MRIENVTNSIFDLYDDDTKQLYVYSFKCNKCSHIAVAIIPDGPGEEYECSSCENIQIVTEKEMVKKLIRS